MNRVIITYTKEVATLEVKVEVLQEGPLGLKFHHKKPVGWEVTNSILPSDLPSPLCHHQLDV